MKTFELVCGDFRLELGKRTCVMGILNVTPDSFSDGGKFNNIDNALEHAFRMIEEGADIIDIGGESTRPFSEYVSEEEETDRVVPVIEKLSKEINVPISIDTSKASVAKSAVEAGATIINDVTAMKDPLMVNVVKESNMPIILMHAKGNPLTMQIKPEYDDVVTEIKDYLIETVKNAELAGIKRSKIVVDPGVGFGKTVKHNLEIINRFEEFHSAGVPVLLGSSRKSFIQKILNAESASDYVSEIGTLATAACAVLKGAHIVRVHDVKTARATCDMVDAVRNSKY